VESLNSINLLKLACGALICALLLLQESPATSQSNIGDGVFYVGSLAKISTPTPTPTPNMATQPIGQVTELADGDAAWTKTDNLKDCEDGYAYVTLDPTQSSNTLVGDLYGWSSILSGSETLVGVQNGLVNYYDSNTGTVTPVRVSWYMHNGGVPYGFTVTDNSVPLDGSLQTYQLGNTTDLSGFAFTSGDAIAFTFGFAFQVTNLSMSDQIVFEIECVNMTLYWNS